MNAETANKLLALNREFYQTFGAAFSSTRRRIQPGVRRIVESVPPAADWLDLGCGNGELARVLAAQGRLGRYLGLDFSAPLLADAPTEAEFMAVDLTADWRPLLPQQRWDVVTAFAALHHIPGQALRLQILKQAAACLPPEGLFIHSEWQFLNSPRWRARVQPWARAGIDETELDSGDYLLDWRHGGEGLRYVHHFSLKELDALAAQSGFSIRETFYSDGREGNLAIYQIWQKETQHA